MQIRSQDFNKYDKYFHLGLYGDLDSMQTSLSSIMNDAVSNLHTKISEAEEEMKNEVVYEGVDGEEELYSTVDYLDYYSNINAKTIIYNSSIISIYSFFETRLLLFCKIHDPSFCMNKKIKGSKIDQLKNYLSKSYNIDFNLIKSEWESIDCYRILRNELAHNSIVELPEKDEYKIKKLQEIEYLKKTELKYSKAVRFQITNKSCSQIFFSKVSKILEFIYYK